MTNEAQNSQANTANLGTATAYAYKLSRTNPKFVALKLWAFGGISASENIAVENIPARLDEIDLGLADGEPFVNIRELSFAISEKLLREIRAELKNFAHNTGGSGSQVPEVEARANRVAESQEPAPADLPGREVCTRSLGCATRNPRCSRPSGKPQSGLCFPEACEGQLPFSRDRIVVKGNENGRGGFASLRRVKSCAPSLGAQGGNVTLHPSKGQAPYGDCKSNAPIPGTASRCSDNLRYGGENGTNRPRHQGNLAGSRWRDGFRHPFTAGGA